MKVLAQLLANEARINREGLIDIRSAGVDQLNVRSFPATNQIRLLTRIQLEQWEIRPVHWLRLRISHGGLEVLPWSELPLRAAGTDPAGRAYLNVVSELRFPTYGPGEGVIEATLDYEPLPELHFWVVPIA
ncbi:MAG: hypothetical protein ACLQT7_06210 [Candidatus Dormibacteria bacterium]